MIVSQILRPFAFNNIKSTDLNVVRFYIPLAGTLILFGFYLLLPKKPEIIGDKKYLDYMLQIVGILPGFYIAALAAGATFLNPSLDEQMPGRKPPTLIIEKMGQKIDTVLTTRLFICHLFSYLSAASLVLAFAILLAIETNPSVDDAIASNKDLYVIVIALRTLQYLYILVLTFYIIKLTTVTLHGLYFLAERMHLGNE